ncbi:MAG: response regulator, partial [Myxococcota bacterium]
IAVGERRIAYGIKGSLLSRGYVVDLASRADEAVQQARDGTPDVVVVDSDLPDIDGPQLIEILRHDPDTQSVPIVAVCQAEMALRVARAGADAHLTAPVETVDLVASIQRLLNAVREGRRALVVDPDREFRAMCAKTLGGIGVLVEEASDGESALRQAMVLRPDLVLTSVELPRGDGFTLFKALRGEAATERASVIFVSNKNNVEDKVRALRMGGEDYLAKPVEPLELAARAEMVLQRREDEVTASPTTRLPGGAAIERELNRRIASGEPYALCYLDLDNLKAFNDYYGYAKADGVIRQTGDLLRDVISTNGSSSDFIGHIAGDDFVFVTSPRRVDSVCEEIIQGFDRVIPLYYSREDRNRGFIEAEDRYGELRRFSIMTVSIAVIVDRGGTYRSHASISSVAAELKKRAKAVPESCVIRDDVLRSTEQTG